MANDLNSFRANLPTTNDIDGGLDRRLFFGLVGASLAATGLSGRIVNADEAPEEQPASSDHASSLTQAASCSTGGTGIFNVKDFCAVGDGVTDDRPAIQAAIAAADAAGGGIVFFPATTASYLITATVQIPSNVFLQGTGPGSTIRFVNATANQSIIQILNASNSGVRDLRIVNSNAQVLTWNHGVHITSHSDGIVVERVQIHNCFRSMNVDSSTNIRIVHCDVTKDHSNAVNPGSAIHLTGTTRSLVLGCRIETAGMHGIGMHEGAHYCRVSGCHVDGAAYAAYYVGAQDYAVSTHNVIVGNSASGCRYGVWAENGCDYTVIEGNNIESSGEDGITIAKGAGPAPRYCTVTGNTIGSSGRHAIWLLDADRCVVSANSIQGAGESGVRIGGGVSNTVSGNQVSGADQAAIFIYSQASHTVICGNAIWDNDGCGIYVQASQHCSIVGNTVQRCHAAGVGAITLAPWTDSTDSFSSYVTITGNVLVDCPYGIYVLPGTKQVIITGNICYPNILAAIFVAGATVVGYTSSNDPGTNVVW